MKKNLLGITLVALLLGGALYGQAKLHLFQKPCAQPIAYSLGSFDNQFGISQTDFLKDVDQAVGIWEQSSGVDLFRYDPNGKLKINLVYDYRQEATDRLKSLGLTIDDTQTSYESLKFRYDQMTADYNQLKSSLDAEVSSYNQKKQSYEQQVQSWNDRGGAPKNVVVQLNAQRDALNVQADKINRDQNTLNTLANNINDMVDVLNRLATNLNLNVNNYNRIGASRGDEFEEGVYISSGRSQQIDIYEFDTQDKLVRVLAHELGHALGLEHIDSNQDAIMYRVNQSSAEKASAEDIAAVKKLCGI